MKKFKVRTFKNRLHTLWSSVIRQHDNYECQWCKFDGRINRNKSHHAHHIVATSLCRNIGTYKIENGMTLCFHCHIDRLKAEIDEYKEFRDAWLKERKLNYFKMRKKYDKMVKFTEDFYNEKYAELTEEPPENYGHIIIKRTP